MFYRTHEIAKLGNVHPNTVRVYEQWGYISPVKREANGYRLYEDIHLLQLQIARLAFRCELIQNALRKKATKIVQASGKEQFSLALKLTEEYLLFLQREHDLALATIKIVERWRSQEKTETSTTTYTHQQVAALLNLTEETLRNWERNGLFHVERNHRHYRVYTGDDIERLFVIRSLRSAHFSIASILRLVQKINHEERFDIKDILNTADSEEIVHITDQLELNLRKAMQDVQQIIALLQHASIK